MRGARLLVAAVLQAAAAGAGGGGVPGGVAPAPALPPKTPSDNFFPATDDDEPLPDLDDDDELDNNKTEYGRYLGAPCEFTCSPKLHHVFCDPITGHCECEKKYPVKLGAHKGCAKPKHLGEQCFYRQACKYIDPHASCIQNNHNAYCQCENGYHSVSYSKPVKRVFCTEDLALLTADVPTLLGVCSGIALLAGLLCLVLHLYTKGRYPDSRAHHFANANISQPMLFSSESGIPMSLQGHRPPSRSSLRSSGGGRRMTGASRTGSRRSSLASLQSTSSSVRSYSMRRFEKEREQKEKRQQMQMRLAQLHANMTGESKSAPTPSPRTPNSTDGLLPSVIEGRELSLSRTGLNKCGSSSLEGIIGPCSSSGTSY